MDRDDAKETINAWFARLDQRLTGIESRLLAIEFNIDSLMHDARNRNVARATVTPPPTSGVHELGSWDDD